MKDNSRKTQLHFVVSEPELDWIRQRMEECGVTNLSAFLRKMALDGYIIHLDMTELQELTRDWTKYGSWPGNCCKDSQTFHELTSACCLFYPGTIEFGQKNYSILKEAPLCVCF